MARACFVLANVLGLTVIVLLLLDPGRDLWPRLGLLIPGVRAVRGGELAVEGTPG